MEGAATGMSAVTAAMSTVIGFVSTVFDAMTSNQYLVIFMAATMICVGIRIFTKLRSAT